VYVAYAALAHTPLMLLTVPFVAYGLARYVYLVRRHGHGEEPENVLLTDVRLVATVVCWTLVAGAVIGLA
jgi:decaprenyl-phosphate phosphoribosyltransferase